MSLFIKNSANIIVQNRLTGQLEEEKMQVYVRLGIRLLYKGASGRMEGARGMYYVSVFLGAHYIERFTQPVDCSNPCQSSRV